jgi:hypothetical protein
LTPALDVALSSDIGAAQTNEGESPTYFGPSANGCLPMARDAGKTKTD